MRRLPRLGSRNKNQTVRATRTIRPLGLLFFPIALSVGRFPNFSVETTSLVSFHSW
jgi:hypothetical protein